MRLRDPSWRQTLTMVVLAACAAQAGAACARGVGSDSGDDLDGTSPEESTGEASLEDQTANTDEASTVEGSGPMDVLTESANPDASGADDAGDGMSGDATLDSLPPPSDSQPAEADSRTCPGVQILCNGACVDPTLDPNHCGGCGVVCKSGRCGATVTAPMTSSPSDWSFNGSAVWSSLGPSAQMTAAGAAGAIGTAIYQRAIVTDAFTVSFQFRIGANGGGRYDGMGFMIESTGPKAIGSGNGSLGMGGLAGYGVEFDVYNNSQCGDVNSDHVGVDSLTPCNSSASLPTSLFASPDLTATINLADGQWHQASVTLASGAMSVTVDANNIAKSIALPGFTPGTSYYYGFSGATGGLPGSGGMQTEVKSVKMTFPTPRCL